MFAYIKILGTNELKIVNVTEIQRFKADALPTKKFNIKIGHKTEQCTVSFKAGIFNYYLATRYTDKKYIEAEIKKCDGHIRAKISDLRKKARMAKGSSQNHLSSSEEESSDSGHSDDESTLIKRPGKDHEPAGSDDGSKSHERSDNDSESSVSNDESEVESKSKQRSGKDCTSSESDN